MPINLLGTMQSAVNLGQNLVSTTNQPQAQAEQSLQQRYQAKETTTPESRATAIQKRIKLKSGKKILYKGGAE